MIRPLSGLILAVLAAALAGPSWSQPYPARPVRLMIPQPPGGTMDTLARAAPDGYTLPGYLKDTAEQLRIAKVEPQ